MKKICICGHFGFGEELLNGQTVKTKIITKELEKHYGAESIVCIDTHGGKRTILRLLVKLFWAEAAGNDIVILPAYNGIQVIVPYLYSLNKLFKRRLFYVVIGGWLPGFLKNKPILLKQLRDFSGIYVETDTMKQSLENEKLKNVSVLPNCKELSVVTEENNISRDKKNRRLCTFSRVMKEKGIQEAVRAVIEANKEYGEDIFSLDIYGQIDPKQKEWFERIMEDVPDYIRYRGLIPFDKSTDVLKHYYLLLFPTYHEGEGFAGTLIDAMAAGIPVIATDWKYNAEIVNKNNIGCLVKPHDINALKDEILQMSNDHKRYQEFRQNCLTNISYYLPENAISKLIEDIGE